MNYAQIMSRIYDNVGRKDNNRPTGLTDTMRNDIFDSLNKIYRRTEPIKEENSGIIITSESQELEMPSGFFLPIEVIFNSTDSQRYPSKELEYEEFMRWNPETEFITTSFTELVTTATPQASIITQENLDYDGLVGYTFTDTKPQKLVWKPAINGTISIYHSVHPILPIELDEAPDIHDVFHELIVLEVTIKNLTRKLDMVESEIQLYGLNQKIKHYKEERMEMLNNLSGFVNKNAETPRIIPFDFLSDYSMLVRNSVI